MNAKKYSELYVIAYVLGALIAVYFGLKCAPYSNDGIIGIIQNSSDIFNNPLEITICGSSAKTVLTFILLYGVVLAVYLSNDTNYKPRQEHGSAKWGNPKAVNAKYADKDKENNKILTQNVSIGLDGRKHRRNLNVLVVGGSGAGKTRFIVKPNVMQANSSFVIADPKGEILKSTGNLLKEKGYEIKVLDLINMDKSLCYNPFAYLEGKDSTKTDQHIQELASNIITNTTPSGSKSSDPFWDTAAAVLLKALIFYLHYCAPEEEKNFGTVMEMLRSAEAKEDDDDYTSPLDELFMRLAMTEPDHIAVKYYTTYKKSAGKTAKSILISLAAHLEKFNLSSVAGLTATDEMELDKLGTRKTAIFAIIPDSDDSFNFIVGMLYTQLFQQLEYQADHLYGGQLPVHVHFLMDEFANVALPENFDKKISTMRSRGISVTIILQNISQLKKLFEKEWESIIGNADEFVYLGGNEQSTHEYVSKLLGKETIDARTYNQSTGRSGNYTKNYQILGRELMFPDEVRSLDNRYALLFIRGEDPIMDLKYDIMKHPNIALTSDGGAEPFIFETEDKSVASILYDARAKKDAEDVEMDTDAFDIFTEQEMYEKLKKKEKENE